MQSSHDANEVNDENLEEKVQSLLQKLGLLNMEGRPSAAFLDTSKRKANFPRNERILVRCPKLNFLKKETNVI